MKGFIITALLLCIVCSFSDLPKQTPIIGIYTQDAQEYWNSDIKQSFQTYIAASYVKNLQMAGAQVIPLFYHYSQTQLDDILGKINGVFFPGGQMPIVRGNIWTDNTAYILEYANKKNKEGVTYPIWATCLGYEAVMYLTSGSDDNTTVFTEVFGQDGLTCPQIIQSNDSVLLKSLNEEEYKQAITDKGIFFYHHRWSVTLQTFKKNTRWNQMWNLISTSVTRDNVEFVSTLQAKEYPYFLTQYHPEKNAFEWRVPANRSYYAVSASQKFINTFVEFARKNPNVYPEEELGKKLIYNYHPVLTPITYAFQQVYLFDESSL